MAEQHADERPRDDGPITTADLARALDRDSGADNPVAEAQPRATLLSEQETGEMRHRWEAIQAGFVDEPRRAVEDADALVAGAMKRLAEVFADERAQLESQWDRGGDVSTEDLRIALQRYRTFFGKLLSI